VKIIGAPTLLQRASRAARARGDRIGFVPTMGFLHEGHLALVRRARRENDLVIASIFVNPLQFGPGEDLASYPRAPQRDRALLRKEGVDLLFEPRAATFTPRTHLTRVSVPGLEENLCGAFRPGHFQGVATIVAKLLNAAETDRLYLGAKDYQQACVLRRMVADLNLPVRVVLCPTVREPDGLAMSSRNTYLTPEERAWAPALYRVLRKTAEEIASGVIRRPADAFALITRELAGGPGRLQYADVLSADDLNPVDPLQGKLVLAAAYFLGKARLIDNVLVRAPRVGQGRPSRSRPEKSPRPQRAAGRG
jgi:pantoate--beta-alanine ligase